MLSKFGDFALSVPERRLTCRGEVVRLTGQPLELLLVLLDEPGRLVTREQIRTQLWPDTTVEFEHSLDVALSRLRTVLGDSAREPVFIETVPRVGYRFVAPVQTDVCVPTVTRRWPPSSRVWLYALIVVITLLIATLVVVHQHYGAVLEHLSHAPR